MTISCPSTDDRTVAVGPVSIGSTIPSDSRASRAVTARARLPPHSRHHRMPSELGAPHGRIRCRDNTATVPREEHDEPDRGGESWFQGVPHDADAGKAALRWRLYPRWSSARDLGRPGLRPAMRNAAIRVTRRRLAVRPAPLRSLTAGARSPASIRRGSCRTPTGRRNHGHRD